MAYTKINWNETTTALNSTNLDLMETQYEEVLAEVSDNMADDAAPFYAEIVSSFPAASSGRIIYNTSTQRFYFGTASDWEIMALPGDSGV